MEPTDRTPRVQLDIGVPPYVWMAVAAFVLCIGLASVILATTYATDRTASRAIEAHRAHRDSLALDRAVDSLLGNRPRQ